MDAGVVSDLGRRRSLRERRPKELKTGAKPSGAFEISRLPVAERPPQPKAARGRLLRRRSSPMRPGIALVAPPCIRPRGARNAASHPFSAACWTSLRAVARYAVARDTGRRRAVRAADRRIAAATLRPHRPQ